MITKILVKILPLQTQRYLSIIKQYLFKSYGTRSYSVEGEDIILDHLISKKKGFYVDVGANHPFRHSNTYHFYKKGWKGINIDPIPGGMAVFNIARPRDINIEAAISDKKTTLTFYMFNDPVLNTVDKKVALERQRNGSKIIGKKEVISKTLKEIFDQHAPKKIDFLAIDVEGHELQVLHANDWQKYLPRFLIIESWEGDIEKIVKSPVYKFVKTKNYRLIARTQYNMIFIHNNVKLSSL